MTTIGEWIHVLTDGAIMGSFMLIVLRTLDERSRKCPLGIYVLYWYSAGFLFGFVANFDWRVLRWPLVLILIAAAASVWTIGDICKKRIAQREKALRQQLS